ncbi:MAG: hypothetical protein ACREQA_14520 [Candidatus Binatia bacterium]
MAKLSMRKIQFPRGGIEVALKWPLPQGLDEATLERLLFPPPRPSREARPLPPMKPLPAEPYVYAEWSKARAHIGICQRTFTKIFPAHCF